MVHPRTIAPPSPAPAISSKIPSAHFQPRCNWAWGWDQAGPIYRHGAHPCRGTGAKRQIEGLQAAKGETAKGCV
ncbi:hypothetical protein J007_02858 [Cryptococcus neoformans]|nr:hypothetical protein J007_02858 [Cryptococcus neoformans var. grubii]